MTSRHQAHVERLLAGAIQNFNDDGYLAPTLILSGPRDALVVRMGPNQDLAPAFAEVAMILAATRRDTDLVVCIVEAWTRSYSQEDGEKARESLRHGDMARAHEAGDPNIHTCLVVQGVDVMNDADDVSVTRTVDGPDAGQELWHEGPALGRMPEMMRDALRIAKQTVLPPAVTTNDLVEVLIGLDQVAFVVEPIFWREEESPPAS